MNKPINLRLTRFVFMASPIGQTETFVVLDRATRGVSELYNKTDAQALVDWLTWRSTGYIERREHPRNLK